MKLANPFAVLSFIVFLIFRRKVYIVGLIGYYYEKPKKHDY